MDENEDLNMEIKAFVNIAKPIYRKAAVEVITSCKKAGIPYQRQIELLRYPELDEELRIEYSDLIEKSEVETNGVSSKSLLETLAVKRQGVTNVDGDLKMEIQLFADIAQPIYRNSVKEIIIDCNEAGIPYQKHMEIIRYGELIEELRKEVPMNLLKSGLL